MDLKKPLNKYFDHTLLKADATRDDIRKLCAEAREYDFYAVCVNACRAEEALRELEGSEVKTAVVCGFPLGACGAEAKAFEATRAMRLGAAEADMVLDIGALKDGRHEAVRADIEGVLSAVREYGGKLKVIIETCLLSDGEKRRACELAAEAGADFVKTSTGFSSGGATAEDVRLMKETVGERCLVKASGGVRSLETALALIEAGADRIGASASVNIMESYLKR